ncbi:MAG: insulinase family protein, partial [Bacteroidetes bacterium]|nr:insulinase family protein [Candidatus Cryptobacteroides merdavium]
EEGGTYGASVGAAMQNEPEARAMIQVYFDTNPEAADRLIKSAVESLKNLAADGPTEEQLTRTIENAKKDLPESRISNNYWLDALMYWNRYGVDYDKEFEAAISEISSENIKTVLNEILSQNNFIEVVMSPEE